MYHNFQCKKVNIRKNQHDVEQVCFYIKLETDLSFVYSVFETAQHIEGIYLQSVSESQPLLVDYNIIEDYIVVYLDAYTLNISAGSKKELYHLIVNVRFGNSTNGNLVCFDFTDGYYPVVFSEERKIFLICEDFYSLRSSYCMPEEKTDRMNSDSEIEGTDPDAIKVELKDWVVKDSSLILKWKILNKDISEPYVVRGITFEGVNNKISCYYEVQTESQKHDFEVIISAEDEITKQFGDGGYKIYLSIISQDTEYTVLAKTTLIYPLMQKEYIMSTKYILIDSKIVRYSFYLLPNAQIRCLVKLDYADGLIHRIEYGEEAVYITGKIIPAVSWEEEVLGAYFLNEDDSKAQSLELQYYKNGNKLQYTIRGDFEKIKDMKDGWYKVVIRLSCSGAVINFPVINNLNFIKKKSTAYCSRQKVLLNRQNESREMKLVYQGDCIMLNLSKEENRAEKL